MAGLNEQSRMELIDVVDVLKDTFGLVTDCGVAIETLNGWNANGVRYIDPSTNEVIREMSATAYAAEFYKVCGGSLDDAEFDEVMPQLDYVGAILGSTVLDMLGVEHLKAFAKDEAKTTTSKSSTSGALGDTMHQWGGV